MGSKELTVLLHQAALGDFLLTWPLLDRLPGQAILVAPSDKARLAARCLEAVDWIDIETAPMTCLYRDPPVALPDGPLASALAQATRVICMTGADALATPLRTAAPDATVAMVQPRPPEHWPDHVTQWHVSELMRAGITPAEQLVRRAHRPAPAAHGPLVIHPGSGGPGKCWALSQWEQFMAALLVAGKTVLPIAGEAEAERWPAKTLLHWQETYGLRVLADLAALHTTLASASAYVGHDAGPTHLAAWLGLPTLVLFGPSLPARWRPLGNHVRVLAPPVPCPMDWLEVSTVVEALQELVARCEDT